MGTLSHGQIWSAIDALAAQKQLAPSALARLAGLDPTSFNRSKRLSNEVPPRPRWPTTESLAKVLQATGISLADFAALAAGGEAWAGHVPLMGFNQAAEAGNFDDLGNPTGDAWAAAPFPGVAEEGAYALEIGDSALEPVYRSGDRIVVNPATATRPGDRVVVKVASGPMFAGRVANLSRSRLALAALGTKGPVHNLDMADVVWVSRIVWATQ